jgi:hypothetical protein
MSWNQTVTSPSLIDLLVQITGQDIRTMLEVALNAQGLKIEKIEDIELGNGAYGMTLGQRVTLSDGRVFEPKLVHSETADGNWGNDIYEYRLKDEEVKVEHIDLSQPENDLGICTSDCGCIDHPLDDLELGNEGC